MLGEGEPALPATPKAIQLFEDWLNKHDVPFERLPEGKGVVFNTRGGKARCAVASAGGIQTGTPGHRFWSAFKQNKPPPQKELDTPPPKEALALARPSDVRFTQLVARDGRACCYCGRDFPAEALTIEHFVARASGGGDQLANLGLACRPCNQMAADLHVSAKMRLALERRAA